MASRASLGPATSLNAIDALDGDDVVPSFTFAVAALFAYPLQDEVAPAGEPPPSPLSGGESPGPRASWFLIFTAGFSAEDDGHACRKLRVGYVSFSMGGDGGMNPE
ncbi:MAG TPA: hypothetical protein VGP33_06545, partial [Chloroflexota bacterium]|nr:hypothetical protein [Chloroflexota bacterium]